MLIESTENLIAGGGTAVITDATNLNGAKGVAVSGNYAYVVSLDGDSFTVIDISNPAAPAIKQHAPVPTRHRLLRRA